MTATDDLRKMLDERGVEWDALSSKEGDRITRWKDANGRYVSALDFGETQYFDDFYWGPTPQQAIEATLGREACHLVRHGSLADWPEMVCWSCSVCNFGWHHSVNDGQFSYCPNCGARVVDE